jgi:hypothetical protein
MDSAPARSNTLTALVGNDPQTGENRSLPPPVHRPQHIPVSCEFEKSGQRTRVSARRSKPASFAAVRVVNAGAQLARTDHDPPVGCGQHEIVSCVHDQLVG